MLYRILFLLCVCYNAFTEIHESIRRVCALKMHEGFLLQSIGQSTSAFFTFNEGYQNALMGGVSVKKNARHR